LRRTAYPGARIAAEHLLDPEHRLPEPDGEASADAPDRKSLEQLIDAAFWASLRPEEGMPPRISLAFAAPDGFENTLRFATALPLEPASLAHVAPAVERRGIHLGVIRHSGELWVWGATRLLPAQSFVVEVVAPGLLVIKQSRTGGKFANLAVLQGDEIKVIDQHAAIDPDCPSLIPSLLGFDSQFHGSDPLSVLIQLAISMREHRRGGSLLVVPGRGSRWQSSISRPIPFAVRPPFSALAALMQADPEERPRRRWQDAVRYAVDGVAGLTAVDGATVISDDYHVLAFGAKIVRRRGATQVGKIVLTEPVEGNVPAVVSPSQLGGTRHLSAAQFAQDQRDSIALVASQDGRFTVFAWSEREQMVHAHRIESLLI
jgi:hypothetical protein